MFRYEAKVNVFKFGARLDTLGDCKILAECGATVHVATNQIKNASCISASLRLL